jgi:chromosome segregation ATPase
MKNPLLRSLQVVGLAPIGHLYESRARASEHELVIRELRAKLEHVARDAAAAREESARLHASHAQATERHAEARSAADAELRDTRAAAVQWKTKAEEVQVQLRELRGRLIEAERVETQLRELLMANESKLDLVEAAINVLDQRTRREVERGA